MLLSERCVCFGAGMLLEGVAVTVGVRFGAGTLVLQVLLQGAAAGCCLVCVCVL